MMRARNTGFQEIPLPFVLILVPFRPARAFARGKAPSRVNENFPPPPKSCHLCNNGFA